jgi:L-rhamnose mutarotase
MTWRIDPIHWRQYRDVHLNPPPGIIEAIQKAGIHNYSIFALCSDSQDRAIRAFAYMEVEGDDIDQALEQLARNDTYRRWAREVGPWVLPQADEGVDDRFLVLAPIFYCQ